MRSRQPWAKNCVRLSSGSRPLRATLGSLIVHLRTGSSSDMYWIDPDSLTETKHRIRQFLVNEHGDVDGFISSEGHQVHVPPHMGRALTKSIHVGELVYVRGVKPRHADLLVALSIESAHGERLEDHGLPSKSRTKIPKLSSRKREMEGVAERVLYAPKGERVGLLFTNGVNVRFDPDVANDLEEFLVSERHVPVSGNLRTTKWGTVLDADYFWHPDQEEETISTLS